MDFVSININHPTSFTHLFLRVNGKFLISISRLFFYSAKLNFAKSLANKCPGCILQYDRVSFKNLSVLYGQIV